MADREDYEVGFGKPPKQTRFAKGKSGNSNGRPKGTQNVGTLLRKISRELVKVNKGGRTVQMSRLEAALQQLANKAASGDPKATTVFLYLHRIYADLEPTSLPQVALDEKEKPVMASILKRILLRNEAPNEFTTASTEPPENKENN